MYLRQVRGRATVVVSGPGFEPGPSPAANAVFRGKLCPAPGVRPAPCRTMYSGEFTSGSGCSAGLSAEFHSHGVLVCAPSIGQVIAGPPEALIIGALLTLQVLDIAIGDMASRGTEG